MSLEQLLSDFTGDTTNMWSVLVAIILSAVLGLILSEVYKRFGQSLSNRRKFGLLLPSIAMTTALIIMVVKSSLALSLGLVGALSIIRFRTAIKEPEELAYLFLTISIGLGMGAGLYVQTTISFLLITAITIFINFRKFKNELGINFIVKSTKININDVLNILKNNSCRYTLRRSNQEDSNNEYSFFIDDIGPDKLSILGKQITKIDPDVNISYYEAQVGI